MHVRVYAIKVNFVYPLVPFPYFLSLFLTLIVKSVQVLHLPLFCHINLLELGKSENILVK